MATVHEIETAVLKPRQEQHGTETYSHDDGLLPSREVPMVICARKGCENSRIAEDQYGGGWIVAYAVIGRSGRTPAELSRKVQFCSIECAAQAFTDIVSAFDAAHEEPVP